MKNTTRITRINDYMTKIKISLFKKKKKKKKKKKTFLYILNN